MLLSTSFDSSGASVSCRAARGLVRDFPYEFARRVMRDGQVFCAGQGIWAGSEFGFAAGCTAGRTASAGWAVQKRAGASAKRRRGSGCRRLGKAGDRTGKSAATRPPWGRRANDAPFLFFRKALSSRCKRTRVGGLPRGDGFAARIVAGQRWGQASDRLRTVAEIGTETQ